MMIEALFKASKIEERYLNIAVQSIEKLLENFYINGELYIKKIQRFFGRLRLYRICPFGRL